MAGNNALGRSNDDVLEDPILIFNDGGLGDKFFFDFGLLFVVFLSILMAVLVLINVFWLFINVVFVVVSLVVAAASSPMMTLPSSSSSRQNKHRKKYLENVERKKKRKMKFKKMLY